jgi:hypothetical protein
MRSTTLSLYIITSIDKVQKQITLPTMKGCDLFSDVDNANIGHSAENSI